MTTPVATEAAPSVLPVTGSGPFTLIVGLIGLTAVGIGWLVRRFAHT
jgi:hypothetical protein